ncbi:hypothetical protein PHLGIDRAFT_16341 [Phlebiopsis gigantea 11061_1 CR5-6]|uniref:NADP-dependent oxidoreductase domain-containing protein n=1 Tax=Phlebiopsis gigantea (strain 11061_1 CR5-6) TaxID=745531 RepID=A0A0C3NDT1_PHLG1|nr:hypothetical protein PHLGIDRAFT_16341 [Phlebiopsis gigantea 11061_1 CR5-6]
MSPRISVLGSGPRTGLGPGLGLGPDHLGPDTVLVLRQSGPSPSPGPEKCCIESGCISLGYEKTNPRIPLILPNGPREQPECESFDPAIAQEFVDYVISRGQVGLDTSRIYCDGTSEQLLGKLELRGAACVDTKVYPVPPGGHKPEKVKASFDASATALNGKKIRVFYLHKRLEKIRLYQLSWGITA